ncbi:MAG: putative sulfate exporter family transporter, partial [Pseudolabrys sp.]
AQVVGAGYAVSGLVGNTAVIVKLFRVFLLLPMVLGVGWYFTRIGMRHGEAHVPVPVFAIVFCCCVWRIAPLAPIYAPVKSVLVEVSTWGLLLAIGALGLGTSVKTIIGLGWRHITTVLGASAIIFAVVTGGLLLARMM